MLSIMTFMAKKTREPEAHEDRRGGAVLAARPRHLERQHAAVAAEARRALAAPTRRRATGVAGGERQASQCARTRRRTAVATPIRFRIR